VSTATFGVVARVASYVIIGCGVAVAFVYVRVTMARAERRRRQPES
jgi:hypothetical protein